MTPTKKIQASGLLVGMIVADLPIARGGVIDAVQGGSLSVSVWMGDRVRTYRRTVMVEIVDREAQEGI